MAVATDREYGLFIGGESTESASGDVRELVEPATGEPLARAAMAGEADVDRAVEAARAAVEGDSVLVRTSGDGQRARASGGAPRVVDVVLQYEPRGGDRGALVLVRVRVVRGRNCFAREVVESGAEADGA